MVARGRSRSPGPVSARSAPTLKDCRKYAREFVRIDLDCDGFITAQEAKMVFEHSGLGNDMLLRIWDLADVSRMNQLGFKDFIAAMHLIRLALAGQPPPPPPAGPPPALIDFLRGFQGMPHELALEGSSRSASASRSRSATPRGTATRLAPSRRDLRKYAREFLRMDADHDGALSADEAGAVFRRSGLGNETLRQVFDLADRSRSGRFGFVEFVAAMHLIRLALGGQPPPANASGLSAELIGFLGSLQESPAELAREGSARSASRARAEAAPFAAQAEPVTAPLPLPTEPVVPSFDTGQSPFTTQPSLPLGAGGSEGQHREELPSTGKPKEKKKKDRHRDRHQEEQAPGFGRPTYMTEPVAFPAPPPPAEMVSPGSFGTGGHGGAIGSRSGAFASPDHGLAQRSSPPSTRMGLPMPDPASGGADVSVLGGKAGASDPHYMARVREILGLRSSDDDSEEEAMVASGASPYRSRVENREGAVDPPRTQPGDYDSRVMWTVLMGAKPAVGATSSMVRSRAAEAAVLPPSSTPFLRTIAPNYRVGDPYQSSSGSQLPQRPAPSGGGYGLQAEQAARSRLADPRTQMQGRPFGATPPSAQLLREQLSALPTAYTSQVPMSV